MLLHPFFGAAVATVDKLTDKAATDKLALIPLRALPQDIANSSSISNHLVTGDTHDKAGHNVGINTVTTRNDLRSQSAKRRLSNPESIAR